MVRAAVWHRALRIELLDHRAQRIPVVSRVGGAIALVDHALFGALVSALYFQLRPAAN
jgi:hypothetical protein